MDHIICTDVYSSDIANYWPIMYNTMFLGVFMDAFKLILFSFHP